MRAPSRRLRPAPVVRRIVPGTIGWWVKTYFADYPDSAPLNEVWFFTRGRAERYSKEKENSDAKKRRTVMPINTATQSIVVHDRDDFLMLRTTNTVAVQLEADEVFTLIRDLAAKMEMGGPVYLVVESDVIYAKDMD